MSGRACWSLVSLVIAAMWAVVSVSSAQPPPDPPHRVPSEPTPRPERNGVWPATVPSETMEPTIPIGATIQADYDALRVAPPQLRDIVVIHPPRSDLYPRRDGSYRCAAPRRRGQMCARPVRRLSQLRYLKRVVGLPGDRLSLRNGRLTRNGAPADEPYANRTHCRGRAPDCDYPRTITVPPGLYFVLGDNRGASIDSRDWGPLPPRALLARAISCTTEAGEPCGDFPPPT